MCILMKTINNWTELNRTLRLSVWLNLFPTQKYSDKNDFIANNIQRSSHFLEDNYMLPFHNEENWTDPNELSLPAIE